MTATARRKLWELGDYQCPILGTCISMAELRKLARKLGVAVESRATEYELHAFFVRECRREGPVAAQVGRFLDRKYRKELRLFAKAGAAGEAGQNCETSRAAGSEEAALEALWKHCLKAGDIPGPFWALVSHPSAGSGLLNRVYGEIHMLSHLMGAANRADLKRLSAMERRLDELGQALSRVQQARRAQKLEWAEKVKDLEEKLEAERHQRLKLDRRMREAALPRLHGAPALAAGAPVTGAPAGGTLAAGPPVAVVATGPGTPAAAMGAPGSSLPETATLLRRLEAAHEENRRQASTVEDLYRENAALRERFAEAAADLERSEAELTRLMPCAEGGGCGPDGRTCGSRGGSPKDGACAQGLETGTCPLSGKSVLYVGGRCSLVRHYRELVERQGGAFLHHDGGLENGSSELHGKLASADVVLCPVDCVSHDACLAVKKACKNCMKPFMMLRSSGLSSLARSLDAVAGRAN